MARSRNIKPGFFTNEELVELPYSTRLLFIGLWTIADRAGRLEDKPKKIKMSLFPADDININEALDELQEHGFIIRYSLDEFQYIQVVAFQKHQNPHKEEKDSIIPAPCKHHASTMQAPDITEISTVAIGLIPDSLNPITDILIADASKTTPAPKYSKTQPFPMFADWEPSDSFDSLCAIAGLRLGEDMPVESLQEFKTFWVTQDLQKTQGEWEHIFIKSLKKEKVKK